MTPERQSLDLRAAPWIRLRGRLASSILLLACSGSPLALSQPEGVNPEAVKLLPQCEGAYQQDRLDSAAECCRSLLILPDAGGRSWLICGLVDMRLGHTADAMAKLRKALALDASDEAWDAYLTLRAAQDTQRRAEALRLEQLGSSDLAAALLEQLSVRSAADECELGRLWLQARDTPRAERAFRRAGEGPLPVACSLRGLGLVALGMGRIEEAREFSRRLEELGQPPLPLPRAKGLPDGLESLKKASSVTRAEMALLLVRLGPSAAAPGSGTPSTMVLDVDQHPLADPIEEVLARGWMHPTADGLFGPERIVDRLEFGTIVAKLTTEPLEESVPILPGTEATPGPIVTGQDWRTAFPELGPLWQRAPYRDLISPRSLLAPISGQEALQVVLGLWHPEIVEPSGPSGSPAQVPSVAGSDP